MWCACIAVPRRLNSTSTLFHARCEAEMRIFSDRERMDAVWSSILERLESDIGYFALTPFRNAMIELVVHACYISYLFE